MGDYYSFRIPVPAIDQRLPYTLSNGFMVNGTITVVNIAMITMRLEKNIEAAKNEFVKTKALIEKELQAEHDKHWYWANLLLTKIALQDFDEIDGVVDTLIQLIPKPLILKPLQQKK